MIMLVVATKMSKANITVQGKNFHLDSHYNPHLYN